MKTVFFIEESDESNWVANMTWVVFSIFQGCVHRNVYPSIQVHKYAKCVSVACKQTVHLIKYI